MATLAELLVKIGADISELQSALVKSEGQLLGFIDRTNQAAVSVGQLALAASTAGAAIAAGLGIAINTAARSQQEFRLLENAIRASGEAIDIRVLRDQANALSNVTEISGTQITTMQRLLVQYGANQEQITKLIPRILDFSVATGRDATDATLIFGRALTGQDQALRRVLGKFGEGIALTENFEGAMRKLDERFGGTAATSGQEFLGVLRRIRNEVNELIGAIGAPFLVPMTAIAKAILAVIQAMNEFAKAHPLVTGALGSMAAALAIVLLGAGGWLAWTLIIPRVIGLLTTLAPLILVNASAIGLMGKQTLAFAAALQVLNVAARASLIGLVLFAIIQIVIHWKQLVSAIAAGAAFVIGFLRNLGRGFKAAFDIAKKEAIETYAFTMSLLGEETKKATSAVREHQKSVEELTKEYEQAAAAAKLVATQQSLAATRAARLQLQQVGLTAEDIQKIERDRQEAIRQANEQELELEIAAKRRLLDELLKTEEASAEQRAKVEQELHDLILKLEDSRRTSAEQTAQAITAAVKASVEARLNLERETIKQELELLKQRLENTRKIENLRLQTEDEIRQRRLELLTVEENTRVTMLRRTGGLEIQLMQDTLSARELLLRTQDARAEAAAIEAAARREDLISRGLLTEEEAQKQVEKEREDTLKRQLQGEARIVQERLDNLQRQFDIERTLIEQEAQVRLLLLNQETEVRRQQVITNQQIREADLQASIAVAKAETAAKIAELNAQFAVQKELLAAQVRAASSPEERAAREDALQALIEGQERAAAALETALVARTEAANQEIIISRRSFTTEMAAIDRELALKRVEIERQLSAELATLQSKNVADRAAAAERLAQLDVKASQAFFDLQKELQAKMEAGEITPAEMRQRLESIQFLRSQIERTLTEKVSDVDQLLGTLDNWKAAIQERLEVLKPLGDALKDLVLGAFREPSLVVGQGNVPAAIGAAAAAGGGGAPVFQLNGANLNLTAEESAIAARVFAKLFGPEGERMLELWMRRQP